MRPLEILLPIILLVYLLWPLTGKIRPPAVGVLPAFALVVTVTHGQIEGLRWQMYPLYGFAIVLFILSLTNFLRERKAADSTPRPSLASTFLPLILLAVSIALPILLPVPTLPRPTGPYTVGTANYVLTDTSRKEIYSGKDEPRRFMVQVWYPAQPPEPGTKTAPWMENGEKIAPALSGFLSMPSFFLDHLVLSRSNSYTDQPVAAKGAPYPVIVFSHGWQSFRAQSTGLMEELASHGYVVIATEHTYGSIRTVFPDGTIAENNPNALPSGKPQDEYETTARILDEQWTADIGYTLDVFATWNKNDPAGRFTNMLDMSKVGLSGHSTGGGAVIQFCSRDPRCKALIPLDPFMRPVALDVLDGGLKQPSVYFFSEKWPFERNTELFNRFYSHLDPPARVLTLLGSAHYDFSDLPALTPLAPQLGFKGPIPASRVSPILRTYITAFFDQYLKGQPTTLFDAPSAEFPEVRFDR